MRPAALTRSPSRRAEFELRFTAQGDVLGHGADDVGEYRISGKHGGGRVAFTKKYRRGSANAAGRVNARWPYHGI